MVTLSTPEAEYISSCDAGKELVWTINVLKELGLPVQQPSVLFNDNEGAISLMKNPGYHSRTKHIDVKHRWITQATEEKVIGSHLMSDSDTEILSLLQFHEL